MTGAPFPALIYTLEKTPTGNDILLAAFVPIIVFKTDRYKIQLWYDSCIGID
jgi:hypothetical protein